MGIFTKFLMMTGLVLLSSASMAQQPEQCWHSEYMQQTLCKRQHFFYKQTDQNGNKLGVIHSLNDEGKILISNYGNHRQVVEKEDIAYLPSWEESFFWAGDRILRFVGSKTIGDGSGIYRRKSFKIKDGDESSAMEKCLRRGYQCEKGQKRQRRFSLRIAAQCVGVGMSPASSYCREASYVDVIWGVKVVNSQLQDFHEQYPNTCENLATYRQFRIRDLVEQTLIDLGCES